MKALRLYLRSKIKASAKPLQLLEYINRHYPEMEKYKKKLTREKVHLHIFPNETTVTRKLDELAARLVRYIEFFWVEKELESNDTLYSMLLSRVFKRRGLDDFFRRLNEKVKKQLSERDTLSQDHFLALFEMHRNTVFHRDTAKFNLDYERILSETEIYLDRYYILNKLKIICERTTTYGILQSERQEGLITIDIQELISKISCNSLEYLYLNIIQLYERNDRELYEKLKVQILNEKLPADNETHFALIIFLMNYCNGRYIENNIDYGKEIFALYHFAEKNGLLIEDGYICDIHYMNVVATAVTVKDYNYAEYLIQKYSNKLKPDYQEDCKALASAILHFAREEYGQTIKYLQVTEMKDVPYKINARCLLTRAYYELSELEALKSYLAAGKKFIRREQTLADDIQAANLNFFNFVSTLVQHKEKSTPDKEVLLQYLQNQTTMVYTLWCRTKVEEL